MCKVVTEIERHPNSMKKRILILLIFIALLAIGLTDLARARKKHSAGSAIGGAIRNVILISLDTLRADHLSCYGYGRQTSPRIDQIARESVLFRWAFADAYDTLNSHMSLMTSLLPTVHRVEAELYSKGGGVLRPLPEERTTLAEAFQQNGYQTVAFATMPPWLSADFGFDQGFDEFHSNWLDAPANNSRIFEWLLKHKKKPFFAFLHYFDAHADSYDSPIAYKVAEPYQSTFIDKSYQGALVKADPNSKEYGLVQTMDNQKMITFQDLNYWMALYDGGILFLDHFIGELFDFLKEQRLLDDSLVIITADHGEAFMEHGRLSHETMYNECMQVPLIMRFPDGYLAGQVLNTPAQLIDIYPTVAELTHLKDDNPFIQGTSLVPFLKQPKLTFRHEIYTKTSDLGWEVLIAFPWKYMSINPPNYYKELYAIPRDPGNYQNLINDYMPQAMRLEQSLQAWAMQVPEAINHFQIKYPDAHGRKENAPKKMDEGARKVLKSLGYGH
jgi:arylsulfatase A-like enzyme